MKKTQYNPVISLIKSLNTSQCFFLHRHMKWSEIDVCSSQWLWKDNITREFVVTLVFRNHSTPALYLRRYRRTEHNVHTVASMFDSTTHILQIHR